MGPVEHPDFAESWSGDRGDGEGSIRVDAPVARGEAGHGVIDLARMAVVVAVVTLARGRSVAFGDRNLLDAVARGATGVENTNAGGRGARDGLPSGTGERRGPVVRVLEDE